jgi:hypothetical protein
MAARQAGNPFSSTATAADELVPNVGQLTWESNVSPHRSRFDRKRRLPANRFRVVVLGSAMLSALLASC